MDPPDNYEVQGPRRSYHKGGHVEGIDEAISTTEWSIDSVENLRMAYGGAKTGRLWNHSQLFVLDVLSTADSQMLLKQPR